MNELTADAYLRRLSSFGNFVSNAFNGLTVDELINRLIEGDIDVFDVLNEYSAYLKDINISALTIKQRVVTVKNFMEHYVDISPRRFKLKVKLPRIVRKNKEALSKEDIIQL